MNERIQELKHQAFLWCDENIPEQYSHETGYGDAWEDKFAELIIQGCISQIALLGISNYENEDISWAVDMAITNIRDRFGLK